MNVISYSLFEPKKFYEHRTYDEDKTKEDRYWYNLPALALINKVLYPEFEMHISVCPNTLTHPLFEFYKELSHVLPNFKYTPIEESYEGHEPALWRMRFLWHENVECLMVRDIDSVPNVSEYKAFNFFMKSNRSVHTIRSHEHHCQYPCRMLIGLSAFKPALIPSRLLCSNFDEFKRVHGLAPEMLAIPTVKWNADQITVINAFTTDEFFTADGFLDTRINNQHNHSDFYCRSINEDDLKNEQVDEKSHSVLSLIEDFKLADWAGKPCDSRGEFLSRLSEVANEPAVMKIIEENPKLKSFYLK